ncbi:MAG: hypothetical protein ABI700_10755 [Chloroflexota bacterium]
MFEHNYEPLLPRQQFIRRQGRYAAAALLMVGGAWLIGILGYRVLEDMAWIDAILNAAMILGGMGPVSPLRTHAGKLFASFYALFAGILFLVSVGLLIAPMFHRVLHQFHLAPAKDDDNDDKDDDDDKDDSPHDSK